MVSRWIWQQETDIHQMQELGLITMSSTTDTRKMITGATSKPVLEYAGNGAGSFSLGHAVDLSSTLKRSVPPDQKRPFHAVRPGDSLVDRQRQSCTEPLDLLSK